MRLFRMSIAPETTSPTSIASTANRRDTEPLAENSNNAEYRSISLYQCREGPSAVFMLVDCVNAARVRSEKTTNITNTPAAATGATIAR